jgi:hypothetical protein
MYEFNLKIANSFMICLAGDSSYAQLICYECELY